MSELAKTFKFYVPLSKNATSEEFLTGIASTISIDKDGERMSEKALYDMAKDIMTIGINLYGNHQHEWENTLGAITKGQIINNQLHIDVTLDDPTTNPKIPMLLNKLKRGIKLGLSVGGEVVKAHKEYQKEEGRHINIIDAVKLYEISVVGIASNGDAYLSIPNQIMKSRKEPDIVDKSLSLNNNRCPLCYNPHVQKMCEVCLWQK